ncbi:MAG: threonine--tRNA ligase [candidate division KSB1 bacterium]|nr:threonine--tRNA ligase [candidate division KSB1 bacterium]
MITIRLPDNCELQTEPGVTVAQVAQRVDASLAANALAAKVDGRLVDLSSPIFQDADVRILTFEDQEGRETYWHSTAHIMAHAVKRLYPDARFGIGPAIEAGFYYDIDVQNAFTPEDLGKIEAEMRAIVEENNAFRRRELSKEEARKLFRQRGETYKLELLAEMEEPAIIYEEGDFVDLCRGPHVPATGLIKHFKLLSVAGAYWRGDEHNPMLQRIYGISFPEKAQLDEYVARQEEARKRDHRRLGKDLDLFSISDEIGPGLVLWHPKGALVRHLIEDFWRREHLKHGYELLYSPHLARLDLWARSGHLDFFRENMFAPTEVEEVPYQIKPMNCPFHLVVYKSRTRSYRELPLRWAELGTVYRYERSGVLHGLLRVRGFTQDDAHLFLRPDQLDAEIAGVLDLTMHMLGSFGFHEYEVFLSTRPERYVGSLENWERATSALRDTLERKGISYQIDPGEGVFYGPKIDIKIKDVLGRSWQCTTVQVDFNEPERFDLTYVGEDNRPHRPIMIHRALLGSMERFFGILIEHYAGAFPIWLAPVQAIVLPVSDQNREYASQVVEQLRTAGIRALLDDSSEKIGHKIREAELAKIPYMLVVGAKEAASGQVAVRRRRMGDLGQMPVERFLQLIGGEIANKAPQ